MSGHGPGFMRGGGPPPAKPKDVKGSFVRLLRLLDADRPQVIAVVAMALVSVGFSVAGPKLLGNATDVVFRGVVAGQLPAGVSQEQAVAALRARGENRMADMLAGIDNLVPGQGVDLGALFRALLIVVGVYAAAALFGWAQAYIMAGVTQRAIFLLRERVDLKLGRLPLRYFDSHPRGDLLSRVTNDIDNISTTLQQSLTQAITALSTVFGILAVMLWISPLLALVALVTVPLSVVVTVMVAKRSRPQFGAQWMWTGKLNGHVEEMFSGHELVAVYGRRQQAVATFETSNEKVYEASRKAQFVSGIIMPATNVISNLGYVGIAVIGALRISSGSMSLGDVQAFIQYSRQFAMPIGQLAGMANLVQSGIASAERVFELLDESEESPEPAAPDVAPQRSRGHVVFDRIAFGYSPDAPLITDLSLEAQPGQTVAIVGPTGAGKTTLVNLLMRFYELDGGAIRLDGVDIRHLRRDDLRRNFGMVLQDAWLFGGTIADNIRYGDSRDLVAANGHVSSNGTSDAQSAPQGVDDALRRAAEAAHVDHLVRTLPDGYDTVLDDEASNLSSGEKQLLTIARAFLADPPILILDEATSSVDTRTEVLVQQAMARLRSGRTSFVIAHRLSTIRNADTILVMDHGDVVERGTHEELLAAGGVYHDLYVSQFTAPTQA
ncbi:MAG: ABC transporter ATP-binding protein [Kineosporiaceae bacterium]|nr:ABC transporter ATP-binding protein [Kineosporiaceae bacterium]MBK7623230.1 ABC transporter ATP-binding protein [Kineosporiaceae bacterium]MBK8074818.1 ABC transporter ATP-binding protein [Kineosporiaceae bacterium]